MIAECGILLLAFQVFPPGLWYTFRKWDIDPRQYLYMYILIVRLQITKCPYPA